MKRLLVVIVVAGCSVPSPRLRLDLSDGPSQACGSTDCTKVTLSCDAVMSIRIYDPKNPGVALVDQCEEVQKNKEQNICAFKQINLAQTELPVTDLEVQVAFYPVSRVAYDETTQSYSCPPPVPYSSVTGFPVEKAPTPALGGRGYYHPGDEEVHINLGCTDLDAINQDAACVAQTSTTQVIATVTDFATRLPVTSGRFDADQLRVAVGEPVPGGGGFILNPVDEVELKLHDALTPSWLGELADHKFLNWICLDVMQYVSETTGVLQCRDAKIEGAKLNLAGMRIQRSDLRKILKALDNEPIPAEGITVGIVLAGTRGAPNYTVKTSPDGAEVTYLTDQGDSFEGTKTAQNGIFLSPNASFPTVFSTSGGAGPTVSAVGGNVAGKITVVVLPFAGTP